MNNCYLLIGKNSPKVASAFAPDGTKLAHELIPELDKVNELPFDLNLVKLTVSKSGLIESDDLSDLKEIWMDYQPNSLAFPLMSERFKSLIENNLTGNEKIDWITCKVKKGVEERPYFILRFNEILDVLDIQKTMFVHGTDRIIRPVFSDFKISAYNIFNKPLSHNLWKITSGIYVKETLKKAIQRNKLTGLDFEKASVS